MRYCAAFMDMQVDCLHNQDLLMPALVQLEHMYDGHLSQAPNKKLKSIFVMKQQVTH